MEILLIVLLVLLILAIAGRPVADTNILLLILVVFLVLYMVPAFGPLRLYR